LGDVRTGKSTVRDSGAKNRPRKRKGTDTYEKKGPKKIYNGFDRNKKDGPGKLEKEIGHLKIQKKQSRGRSPWLVARL